MAFAHAWSRREGVALPLNALVTEDPPDGWMQVSSLGRVAIELREIVYAPAREQNAYARKRALADETVPSTKAGGILRSLARNGALRYARWDPELLADCLTNGIAAKDTAVSGFSEQWLVLHGDDHFLTEDLCAATLRDWPVPAVSHLDRAWLLLGYVPSGLPGVDGRRPLFRLPPRRA